MDPQTQSDPLMRALAQRVAEMNAQGGGTMTSPGMLDPSAIGRDGATVPRNRADSLPQMGDAMSLAQSLQFVSPVASQLPAAIGGAAQLLRAPAAQQSARLSEGQIRQLMEQAAQQKHVEDAFKMRQAQEAAPFPPGVGFEGTTRADREALARFLARYELRPFNEGSLYPAAQPRHAVNGQMEPWNAFGDFMNGRGR
jgi:hypothetical protein